MFNFGLGGTGLAKGGMVASLIANFYLDFDDTIVNKTDEVAVSITVRRLQPVGAASVVLTITGGKESGENHGFGKNYIGAGTWLHDRNSYEESFTVVEFANGEESKTVTLAIVNNPVLELDRVMTAALSQPSEGSVFGGTKSITIIDDNIPETDGHRNIIDATAPNTDYDTAAAYARGLSAVVWDGATNDSAAVAAMINWLDTNGGGISVLPSGSGIVYDVHAKPGVTIYGQGIDSTIITRPDKRAIENPVSISAHASTPTVTTNAEHGLVADDLVCFTIVTQDDWVTALAGGDQRDGYMFIVKTVPTTKTFTMNYVNVPDAGDESDLDSSGFAAYAAASNPGAMMHQCYKSRRNFNSGNSLTTFNQDYDSKPRAFWGLTFDGNSENQGPYRRHDLEQAACIFGSVNKAYLGNLVQHCEQLKFINCTGDGIGQSQGCTGYLYFIEGQDVFRGGITIGARNRCFIKKFTATNLLGDCRGLQSEGEGEVGENNSLYIELEDITLVNTIIDLACENDASSHYSRIVGNRIHQSITADAATLIDLTNNFYAGVTAGNEILIKDSTFVFPAYNTTSNIKGNYLTRFENCIFYAGGYGGSIPGDKSVMLRVLWNLDTRRIDFDNCQFLASSVLPPSNTKPVWAFDFSSLDWDPADAGGLLLHNCYVGSGLNTIFGGNYFPKTVISGRKTQLLCNTANVGGTQTYGFYLSGRDGNYNWVVRFIDNIDLSNMTYPIYILGYSSAPNDSYSNYIFFGANMTVLAANNYLGSGSLGFKMNNHIGVRALHPTAITRHATNPTVTCPGHEFANGDRVMFDGLNTDAEWNAGLCPDSDVPLFTVSEASIFGGTFKINLNNSGYAADYNGTTETKLMVWKHPGLRIITGTTGDDPTATRPAGLTGDRYVAGSSNYYCKTSGKAGVAEWAAE